jgi:hypothetical protein
MAEEAAQITAGALIARIAEMAKRTPEDVRAVLVRKGVSVKQSIAVPHRLCVRSLAFTGEKKGEKAGPINFEWNELGRGFLAITSERNFRGKSTLLAMIRWCLNGRRGGGIPSEMETWFHTVRLTFTLDEQLYGVDIVDAVACAGALWRHVGGSRQRQATFSSDEEFEDVMSEFFMGQLGLQSMVMHAVRDGKGSDQEHDWVWLSGAMVIEPDPKILFGSAPTLGVRMMQMYLGVPWVNALSDVRAAQARITNETRQATSELERSRVRRKARVSELDKEISDLQSRLRKLPRAEDLRASLRDRNREFAEADAKFRAARLQLSSAADDLEAAKEAYDGARRDLQDFKDGRAASFVFRSLEPVSCPRCVHDFDEERKQESRQQHVCMVCGEPETEDENPALTEAGLKDAVAQAEAVLETERKRHGLLQEAVSEARADMEKAEKASAEIEAKLVAPSEARELELDIVRRQAQRDELAREEAPAPGAPEDEEVLKIAERVISTSYKSLQDALLNDVSELIKHYAVLFGMEGLERARLKGNTHLDLVKGGVTVPFGDQTAGEKARLKIATTLALIKVAEQRGVGRHPGLLLIDSPGASEMVEKDYAALVAGLKQLTGEIPHTQVFMAAIDSDVVRQHVPSQNMRYAAGDDYLW